MADLSNLLGDVYGDAGEPGAAGDAPPVAPVDRAPEAPAWADESRLDEAFADWKPEPLEAAVARVPTSAPLDDDLAAALSAALADAPRPVATVAPAIERFRHVEADEPLDPPVLDGETLEPAAPLVDVDALESLFVAPMPVDDATADALRAGRRRFARARRGQPEPAPAVTVDAAVDTAPSRAWQRRDDDILPAGGRRRR